MNRIVLLLLFSLCVLEGVASQNIFKRRLIRTGFHFSTGNQSKPIEIEADYLYGYKAYKFPNQFCLDSIGNFSLEFQIEPAYYRSTHQLVNLWYISHLNPTREVLLSQFVPLKYINEYVLNLGLIYKYNISSDFSIYALFNAGPMYIDTETERLAKGFAFSDIFGLGFNYRVNSVSFDIKGHYRHVSNANLQKPNFGLNAFGLDLGMFYELK